MIKGTSSKPIDIPGRNKESCYNKYKSIKENEKIGFLDDSEELELLIGAIEEMAKRNLKTAKELYFKDFKNLKFPKKNFHKKNLEILLGIKKI